MHNSHELTTREFRGLLPKHQGKSWRLSKACTVKAYLSSMHRFCAFQDAASHAKFNHLWPASSPLALVSSVSFIFPSSARSGIFSSGVSSMEDAIFVHFVETVGTWAKEALWNEQNLNIDVYHVQRLQHIIPAHVSHIMCFYAYDSCTYSTTAFVCICPEPEGRLRPKTFQTAKEILNQGCQIMFKERIVIKLQESKSPKRLHLISLVYCIMLQMSS